MITVFTERTQPEHPLLRRMWFLLVSRCDAFTLRLDGREVVVSVGGDEHRVPAGDEGMTALRARLVRPRTPPPRKKRTSRAEEVFAALTHEWQSTVQLHHIAGVPKTTVNEVLDELFGAGRVERQGRRRTRGLREWTWRLPQ